MCSDVHSVMMIVSCIQEREMEIASLKTKVSSLLPLYLKSPYGMVLAPSLPQVLSSPLSPHSHTEMESRLHELTENLIQKQTTLEALSSEKTALRLQLERTEVQPHRAG